MDPAQWLSLFAVCLLGAVSPGPSLAVVMNSTLAGGRGAGLASALAHGLGVALYGLLTVAGLALVITGSPRLFALLQLLGALYLIFLGYKSLRSQAAGPGPAATTVPARGAAASGFLVAFLNPKLAVFMLALFSQFLSPGATAGVKGIMVATVGITDALWYSLVAMLVSHPTVLERLQARSVLIDRVFGVLLLVLGATVMLRALL